MISEKQTRIKYSTGEAAIRMQAAIQEIQQYPDKAISKIASFHKVNGKALTERANGRIIVSSKLGRPPYLTTEEEEKLVHFLIEVAELGYGYSQKQRFVVCKRGRGAFSASALRTENIWLSLGQHQPVESR